MGLTIKGYELKNVKVSEHLSEETTAFNASLYKDGKRIGDVSNHGTGGPNRYDLSQVDKMAFFETAKELRPEWKYCADEGLIEDLLERFEISKIARKFFRQGNKFVVYVRAKGMIHGVNDETRRDAIVEQAGGKENVLVFTSEDV